MNNILGGKIMTEFPAFISKIYSRLTDNNDRTKKKQKAQKSVS